MKEFCIRMFQTFLYGGQKFIRGLAVPVPRLRTSQTETLLLIGCLLLPGLLLASCSSLSFGSSASSSATVGTNELALRNLHWCGKPLMIFRDEGASATPISGTPVTATATATAASTPTTTPTATAGASASMTPTTLTDWQTVKGEIGFTTFLPPTLPTGTCLVSAYGMVHDPILGGSFTIGYLLPNHTAMTLSEAPMHSQSTAFACNVTTTSQANTAATGTPSATQGSATAPLQVCNGVHGTTSIVFSAQGTTAELQTLFNALQPDVTWIPTT